MPCFFKISEILLIDLSEEFIKESIIKLHNLFPKAKDKYEIL